MRKKACFWVCLLCLCFCLGAFLGNGLAQASPVRAMPLVMIDPGHGGADGGCGKGGPILEKDLNLQLGLHLAAALGRYGIRTRLTRADDRHLGPTHRRDLLARVAMIRESGADLAVCLHADWHWRGTQRGPYVFYARDSAAGKLLAESVQQELNRCAAGQRQALPARDLLVIREADCPAILAEVGFLSHPEEARLLTETAYQEKLAAGMALGIVRYLLQNR